MTTRFTKVRPPKESRTDIANWIIEQLSVQDRDRAMRFLMAYFTTVDLDLIKQDMVAIVRAAHIDK
jgi:hypothetical protein